MGAKLPCQVQDEPSCTGRGYKDVRGLVGARERLRPEMVPLLFPLAGGPLAAGTACQVQEISARKGEGGQSAQVTCCPVKPMLDALICTACVFCFRSTLRQYKSDAASAPYLCCIGR